MNRSQATPPGTESDDRIPRSRPLRVLFGLSTFPVLSETFVIREIDGLIRAGHHVSIAAMDQGQPPFAHPAVQASQMLEKTTYLSVPEYPAQRILGAFEPAARLASARGLKNVWRALSPLAHGRDALTFRPLFEAAELADLSAFDVIHCHFGPAGLHGARWKRCGIGKRLAVTFHANDLIAPVRLHGPGYYRRLFRDADLLLAVSEHGVRRLVELGAPESKLAIQVYPIDPQEITLGHHQRVPDRFRTLSIGRLVEKKGIDNALSASSSFARKHPELSVSHEIIGDGPEVQKLEQLAKEAPDNLTVEFRGAQPPREVHTSLQQCDVFILPSRTARDGDEEGQPNVLLEAMAAGLPVIATWHAGTPELITDGVTGLLAPEDDWRELVSLLERIWEDPTAAEKLGRAAREKILRERDLHKTTEDLVTKYRRLVLAETSRQRRVRR